MKELFPGYYRKTDEEIKKIWENGLIVFDTNILLNLYRYSDSTRNTILNLIQKFSNQIYLPYQAALEYNRNRCEVISEQEKAHKEFLEKITQIKKDLQTTNKPPFLSEQIDNDLNIVFGKVNTEVEDSIKKFCNYLKEDPIYDKITHLFQNKISESYDEQKLSEVYKEGEERFKNKIPPGFEDEKNKDGNRKFGDLVLWKQVIDLANKFKKDIILITDERKSDWWWKIKDGRTMGPRQELVQEIRECANVNFHMYSSERFLSYGQTFLNEKINKQALEEILAMKKAEIEEIKKLENFKRNESIRNESIRNEISHIQSLLKENEYVLSNINNDLDSYSQRNFDNYYNEEIDNDITNHYKLMIEHKNEFEEERDELLDKLKQLKNIYSHNKR